MTHMRPWPGNRCIETGDGGFRWPFFGGASFRSVIIEPGPTAPHFADGLDRTTPMACCESTPAGNLLRRHRHAGLDASVVVEQRIRGPSTWRTGSLQGCAIRAVVLAVESSPDEGEGIFQRTVQHPVMPEAFIGAPSD